MRRALAVLGVLVVLTMALWYLRDPAWLAGVSSGLRPWERDAAGLRYRWSGAHASFFVPADASAVRIPVSTTFGRDDPRPMLVTATVDDGAATRIVLRDEEWYTLTLVLPPRGSRRVRRIDLRTSVTRADNHGVRVGEIDVVRVPVAAGLLEKQRGGAYPVPRPRRPEPVADAR
jgi:hypothetical protein